MSVIYDDISQIVSAALNSKGDCKVVTGVYTGSTFNVESFEQSLPESSVIIPSDYSRKFYPISGCPFGTPEISIDNSLKSGDRVWLLTANSGQTYVVLGRV